MGEHLVSNVFHEISDHLLRNLTVSQVKAKTQKHHLDTIFMLSEKVISKLAI